MNKKIEFKYQDTDYCLEYNRDAIRFMESKGFNYEEFTKQPMNMSDLLFQGAFIKNHRKINSQKINEIFDEINDKKGLISALLEMYQEVYAETFEESEQGKNVEWKIS